MSAGSSAAATSSITAGTSSSATTSWICGAARAAASAWRWAPRARASCGLGGERGSEWGAVAPGARERGRQRGDPRRGSALLELRDGGDGRDAEARTARRAAQLAREQARVAAADLRERAARGEPGGDRDPQQVEHVSELGLDQAPARASAPVQPGIGREERSGGRGEQKRRPEPSGRARRERCAGGEGRPRRLPP